MISHCSLPRWLRARVHALAGPAQLAIGWGGAPPTRSPRHTPPAHRVSFLSISRVVGVHGSILWMCVCDGMQGCAKNVREHAKRGFFFRNILHCPLMGWVSLLGKNVIGVIAARPLSLARSWRRWRTSPRRWGWWWGGRRRATSCKFSKYLFIYSIIFILVN